MVVVIGLGCGLHYTYLHAMVVVIGLGYAFRQKYPHEQVDRLIRIVVPVEALARDMDQLWDRNMDRAGCQACRAYVKKVLDPSMVGDPVGD